MLLLLVAFTIFFQIDVFAPFPDLVIWLKTTHQHLSIYQTQVKEYFLMHHHLLDCNDIMFCTWLLRNLTKKIPSCSEQQWHLSRDQHRCAVVLHITGLDTNAQHCYHGHEKPGFCLGWGFFYGGFSFPIHWFTALDLQSTSTVSCLNTPPTSVFLV